MKKKYGGMKDTREKEMLTIKVMLGDEIHGMFDKLTAMGSGVDQLRNGVMEDSEVVIDRIYIRKQALDILI